MDNKIIPSAEPFFHPGKSPGFLLVHGFTGAPKEMRFLSEYISNLGHAVLSVRLTGHATTPEDMIRSRWQDWYASVEDGYHILNGAVDDVIIAGLSMGGVLSLLFAANYPVRAVISMSTPYDMPDDPRLKYLPILQYLKPYFPKGESDWHNPDMEDDHISYPEYPTRSLMELQTLLSEMRGSLKDISCPALLMHSRNDKGVDIASMEKIYDQIGSKHKEKDWVNKSGHVIIRDTDRDKVFKRIKQFIERL